MSKRSRDVSLSPSSDNCVSPVVEGANHGLEFIATLSKYNQMDSDACFRQPARGMQCTLVPHREAFCFDSQEQYELHYAKEHINRCMTCSKNFPSPYFLEIHIEENHDALREALAARGENTYSCLVEGCDRKCSTPQKRRLHLIDKHMFPRTYNFRIVDQGIDKVSSMLREGRRRRVSTANDNQGGRHRRQASSKLQNLSSDAGQERTLPVALGAKRECHEAKAEPVAAHIPLGAIVSCQRSETTEEDLDSLTKSLSALRFVPLSVIRRQSRWHGHAHDGTSRGKEHGQGHARWVG